MIGGLPPRPDGEDHEAAYAQWLADELTLRRKTGQTDGIGVSRTTRGDFIDASQFATTGGGGGARVKMLVLRDVLDDYLICIDPPKGPDGSSPRWLGQLSGDGDDDDPIKNDAYYNFTSHTFRIFFPDEWVEMTVSSTLVYVAKQPPLRNKLFGERILGVTHDYTYNDGPSEVWSVGTDTRFNLLRTDNGEVQRVVRPYVDGEILYAIRATTGVRRPDPTDEDPEATSAVNLLEISPSRQWAGPAT